MCSHTVENNLDNIVRDRFELPLRFGVPGLRREFDWDIEKLMNHVCDDRCFVDSRQVVARYADVKVQALETRSTLITGYCFKWRRVLC